MQQVEDNVDDACRSWVAQLGAAGFLRHCVAARYGGASERLDLRTLCLMRETLAYHDGLADFAFAMQGLGSAPLAPGRGARRQRERWLPRSRAARRSPRSRSPSRAPAPTRRARDDGAGATATAACSTARRRGSATAGSPTSTACSRARARRRRQGHLGVRRAARRAGLSIAERSTRWRRIRSRASRSTAARAGRRALGARGEGFKLAMRTLDVFRASVAAAALGFARRALDEPLAHAKRARCSAAAGDLQLTQAALGDLATASTARRSCYRARRGCATRRPDAHDARGGDGEARRDRDRAQAPTARVQLHGGEGVRVGSVVERLYREVRALRIYEGATEVQR
jgi:acyl-CoA dehydrogenase